MRYLPQTPADVAEMLERIGVAAVEDLFAQIPAALRDSAPLALPPPLSEVELCAHFAELGERNIAFDGAQQRISFLGAGLHAHHLPAAIETLSTRSEFATAYTPYQPELAQGTLLAIFEFQTAVAALFGMEYANASMYDGASATAEAILMARRLTGRTRALISAGLHPEYRHTCQTYLSGLAQDDEAISIVPLGPDGRTPLSALTERLTSDTACMVLQSPSFFGTIEDLRQIVNLVHEAGGLLIVAVTEPLALALLAPPGEVGADIAVGEGIGLAAPPTLGGPGVGLFATRGTKALRSMPGRLVGQTQDRTGRQGYVLTLSTREQHIRRDKATSNICTNHGLIALRLMIHLALLGRSGFCRLAEINLAKAAYLHERLTALAGVHESYPGAPFFNEFCLTLADRDAAQVVSACSERGVIPGVALGRFDATLADRLLVAVNETHRRADLDRLIDAVAHATGNERRR